MGELSSTRWLSQSNFKIGALATASSSWTNWLWVPRAVSVSSPDPGDGSHRRAQGPPCPRSSLGTFLPDGPALGPGCSFLPSSDPGRPRVPSVCPSGK